MKSIVISIQVMQKKNIKTFFHSQQIWHSNTIMWSIKEVNFKFALTACYQPFMHFLIRVTQVVCRNTRGIICI